MDSTAVVVSLLFGALMGWGFASRHARHGAITVALLVAIGAGTMWLQSDRLSGLILLMGGGAALVVFSVARRSYLPEGPVAG